MYVIPLSDPNAPSYSTADVHEIISGHEKRGKQKFPTLLPSASSLRVFVPFGCGRKAPTFLRYRTHGETVKKWC